MARSSVARKHAPSNELTPWYEIVPKGAGARNPGLPLHGLQLPFRMVIMGPSGGGKSQLLLDMLKRMPDTFNHIFLCTKCADEPLYAWLVSKLPPGTVTVTEGIENIPDINSVARGNHGQGVRVGQEKDENDPWQALIVFDDMVNESDRDHAMIKEYFVRGRKKGISCVYLAQSFYGVPKRIRQNLNYVFLRGLTSARDVSAIIRDCGLGLDGKELLNVYHRASQGGGALLIDPNAKQRFRRNFTEILD